MQNRYKAGLFTPRLNDFKKTAKTTPLSKDGSMMRPTKGEVDGGSATCGLYRLRNYTKHKTSYYFVGEHWPDAEYFAFEVLQLIGINTPKGRAISGPFKNSEYKEYDVDKDYCASKRIDGYIPMCYFRRSEYTRDLSLNDPKQRYVINQHHQTIYDLVDKKHYKISGNTFAAYVGALLVEDIDFKEQHKNFGLIRVGNRFYSIAIDKDCASFNGKTYRHIYWRNSDFFDSCELDQQLAVVYAIYQALQVTDDNQCDFDRIFLNSRVANTPELAAKSEKYCEQLKITARSIIAAIEREHPNWLTEFEEREAIRKQIAKTVTDQLSFPETIDSSDIADIQAIIVEDLRGPYFSALFAKKEIISTKDAENKELLEKVTEDTILEFNATKTVTINRRLSN